MPPNKNIKKGAAALFQNSKEIDRAKKHGATFGAVTKRLGNGGFSVQLATDKTVIGTPRGLFTKGSMAINVGQVVIVTGTDRPKGDSRPALPWEIVALIDDKATADLFVKKGFMSSDVLGFASSAGASGQQVVEDDLFEASDSDEDFWAQGAADVRGGLKAERKSQEASASIAARVASLKCGRGKQLDGGVAAGNMADPTLFSGDEQERFKRWRAHKAKAAAKVASGGALIPAAQTVAEMMELFRLEAESARLEAEQSAIVVAADAAKNATEAKAWLAKQQVKENWDDEEAVKLEDL
uniref:S1-like domain-containing protein n=1 Tax=viral metagenome TaxID=1070528 RepID=A0A6C0AMH1_9ZZZZ